MENFLFFSYMVPALFWILWIITELQLLYHQLPQPKVYLSLAVITTGVMLIRLRRLWPQFGNLNRGEKGELLVAEQLEELRADGFRCFHDLVRNGFNVDHVVVGPPGVFVIETKYRSGSGVIECRNGSGVLVDGRPEERDPVRQAVGSAREVRELIRKDASLDVWVKPVVVFVGDWKGKDAYRNPGARVLTTNRLLQYLRDHQPELKRSEIHLIASHLERTAKAAA